MKFNKLDSISHLQANFFKPLAGISPPKEIISRRPTGRGMSIVGKTSREGILYKTRCMKSADLYGCPYVAHSVYFKEQKYPQTEIRIFNYDKGLGRIKNKLELVYDFITDFNDFIDTDKVPLENFRKYFLSVPGKKLKEHRLHEKKSINLKGETGILKMGKSEGMATCNYLELKMVRDQMLDGAEVLYQIKSDKKPRNSEKIRMLLEPLLEDVKIVLSPSTDFPES